MLLGSSGAGKSTLTNTLTQSVTQGTGAVRSGVAPDRLANYHKLCREVSRDRADPLARQTAKAEIKSRQRALRAMQKERGR